MGKAYTFDTSFLRALAIERGFGEELSIKCGISRDKLDKILSGKAEIKYSDMFIIACELRLTAEEFERCFFMPKSSENLN